jgi:hypothetical protein
MTDARLGGLGREALVDDAGQLRAAGLVREALVAGIGLGTIIGTRSAAACVATVLSSTFALAATIKTTNSSAAARVALHLNMGAQIDALSAARGHFPTSLVFAARITAQSEAQLARVAVVVMAVRITAISASRVLAIVASVRAREGAVTVNTS